MNIFRSLIYTLLLCTITSIYTKQLTIERKQITDHSLSGTQFRQIETEFDNPWANETFCRKANGECDHSFLGGFLGEGCNRCKCDGKWAGGSWDMTFVSYKSGCMDTENTLNKLSGMVSLGPWYNGTQCGMRIPRPQFKFQRVP